MRSNENETLTKLIKIQILAITCDNMMGNDKMINKLAARLVEFPGAPNHVCCFTHILNLVVRSIMHQFNVSSTRSAEDITDERTNELFKLAGNIETEEMEA